MTEITPLFGESFSYSGVVYEKDVFDISLNDRKSEKNIPGFYSCSWRRMLLHAHQRNTVKITHCRRRHIIPNFPKLKLCYKINNTRIA